jgi:hypothetical protein
MIKQPIREDATVATIRSLRIFSKQEEYPGLTGSNLHDASGWITRRPVDPVQLETGTVGSEHSGMQSETLHVPPLSVRIEALTAKMYAMVRKVAVPARNSVVKVELRSASLNLLPTRVLAT